MLRALRLVGERLAPGPVAGSRAATWSGLARAGGDPGRGEQPNTDTKGPGRRNRAGGPWLRFSRNGRRRRVTLKRGAPCAASILSARIFYLRVNSHSGGYPCVT